MNQVQPNSQIILKSAFVAVLFLILPLTANQIWNEFYWQIGDFVIAWLLVFGAVLAFKLLTRTEGRSVLRVAWGIAIAALFILAWMNLAVGLIGNEGNPANLLYLAVFIVFIIGSVLVRFQAKSMWRVLVATAAVQFLIPFLALLIFRPNFSLKEDLTGMLGVIGINTIFTVLFLLSARLFKHPVNYIK